MASFKDTEGRTWIVTIPFSLARAKKNEGIDYLDPMTFGKVLEDVYAASDLLWELCQAQATQIGVSESQFHDLAFAVKADAWAALVKAIEDFFRQCGNHAAATMLGRSVVAAEKLDQHKMVQIEAGAFDPILDMAVKEIDAAIERTIAKAKADQAERLGTSSGR